MLTPGKLEMVIKISALPSDVTTDANGWKAFDLNCDGVRVTVRVRPKLWTKLETAAQTWPLWLAAIKGKLGERTADGFILAEPAIETFERKARPDPASPATPGTAST